MRARLGLLVKPNHADWPPQFPLVAPLRHADGLGKRLFIGVDRKRSTHGRNDAIDPQPTPANDPERAGAIGNGQINPACCAGNQDIEEGERVQWARLSPIAGAGNRSSMNLA
jgi:hypothetical protein